MITQQPLYLYSYVNGFFRGYFLLPELIQLI